MRATRKYRPNENLNLNVRDLNVSATLYINERSQALKQMGREVFKMGLGQSPFPVPDSVVASLRDHAHQKDYLPVRGLASLREAVADFHRRTQSMKCSADDVLIGPGSKELMFLLQLVYYGDLIIPTPSWVSYAPQAHIIGRHVRWLGTSSVNSWHLTANELENYCARDPNCPRIIILNYPSNPTGSTYGKSELQALARVARKYRVILLSDEIYGELHYEGNHLSIANYYPEGTIVSSGLSKWCGAGGWRLGTFVFPESLRWLLDGMAVVASETYTSTSAPVQHASVRAFQGGPDIDDYLNRSRRILAALGRHLYQRLTGIGITMPVPQGAFYLFPDFSEYRETLAARGITSSLQLVEAVLEETGVAFLPGSVFGRPPEELSARLAFVDFDGATALEAANRIAPDQPLDEAFLKQYCGHVLEAAERLSHWLRKSA